MIRFCALCFLFVFMAGVTANAGESAARSARFFSSMQDVPIIEGIAELPDQAVTYDKPEGRIIESVAEVERGTIDSVRSDYRETLPQLGWAFVSEGVFIRESEVLSMNFETIEGRIFVRFMIRPRD